MNGKKTGRTFSLKRVAKLQIPRSVTQMKISITKPDGSQLEFILDKLVTTIGFGEGCDIQMGPADKLQRIGMFIRQDKSYNFKSLLGVGEVLYGGMPVAQMIENAHQAVFASSGYSFRLIDEEQFMPAKFERLDRSAHHAFNQPMGTAHFNLAGARNAYQREVQTFDKKSETAFVKIGRAHV